MKVHGGAISVRQSLASPRQMYIQVREEDGRPHGVWLTPKQARVIASQMNAWADSKGKK